MNDSLSRNYILIRKKMLVSRKNLLYTRGRVENYLTWFSIKIETILNHWENFPCPLFVWKSNKRKETRNLQSAILLKLEFIFNFRNRSSSFPLSSAKSFPPHSHLAFSLRSGENLVISKTSVPSLFFPRKKFTLSLSPFFCR